MARKRNGDQAAQAAAGDAGGEGTPPAMGGNKPDHVEKLRGVRVAVWLNTNPQGNRWATYKLTRRYKDEASGEWRSTESLTGEEPLIAALLYQRAYQWVQEQLQAKGGDGTIPE